MLIRGVEIKSAEIIDGIDKVASHYAGLIKNLPRVAGYSAEVKDGMARFKKPTGFVSKAGMKVPDVAAIMQLCIERGVKGVTQAMASRVIPYRASDERVDGQGDIVKQEWIMDEYKTNPVLCNSHNWGEPPIGAGLDWKIVADGKDGDYEGPMLALLAYFASMEQGGYPEDRIYRLAASGILKAGSVGFFSDKTIDIKDDAERAKLGLGRWGSILASNHLLEFSPCTIGANSGALSQLASAVRTNALKPEDIGVLREYNRQGSLSQKDWIASDASIVNIAKMVFRDYEFAKHKDYGAPMLGKELEALKLKHFGFALKAPNPGAGNAPPKPDNTGIDQKPTNDPAAADPSQAQDIAGLHQKIDKHFQHSKDSHNILATHGVKMVQSQQETLANTNAVAVKMQGLQDQLDTIGSAVADLRAMMEKLVASEATEDTPDGTKPKPANDPAKPAPKAPDPNAEKGGSKADDSIGSLAQRLVAASNAQR
jgi:hypothetical protein